MYYWDEPEITAETIDADGWYHSGDLGSIDAEGMLHFRGRKKDMIALPDGQKVYPEDVEAVLRGPFGSVRRVDLLGGSPERPERTPGTHRLALGPWEIATLHLA